MKTVQQIENEIETSKLHLIQLKKELNKAMDEEKLLSNFPVYLRQIWDSDCLWLIRVDGIAPSDPTVNYKRYNTTNIKCGKNIELEEGQRCERLKFDCKDYTLEVMSEQDFNFVYDSIVKIKTLFKMD